MPSLYTKRNDGTWVVPKKVHAKDGTNTWNSCSRVFRKDDTTSGPYGNGWVKHWPPTTYFIGSTRVTIGPYTDSMRDGWSGWREFRVSEAYRTTSLCHLKSFTSNAYSWWTDRDDNPCQCDGGIYQYLQVQSSMVFQQVSPNIRPVRLNTPVYSASAGHTSAASSTYLRTATINVPHDHILVGIKYRLFYQASGAYSAYEFQLITAQMLDANNNSIPATDITYPGVGYASTLNTQATINGFAWGGANTAIVPDNYTARAVTFGVGCSSSVYRLQLTLTSFNTKVD